LWRILDALRSVAMAPFADYLLPVLLFGSAALYTSVGHAGASAYLASMALVGVAP
jgi:uncharacterized protein